MGNKIEIYKALLEEHRFLTDLSWKIFGIGATILFATPFVLLKFERGILEQSWLNFIVGSFGLLMALCLFWVLFNYRRRENILEELLIGLEKDLKIHGIREVRERIWDKPFLKFLPKQSKELHKNRWPMGIMFLGLFLLYVWVLSSQVKFFLVLLDFIR